MEQPAPATLDTTVAAAAASSSSSSFSAAAAGAASSPPHSPLHASYREFLSREKARAEDEARPPPVEPTDPRTAPVEIAADQPGARLLEPVQPFYSSALLEPAIRSPPAARKPTAAAANRRSNSMQQPASAADSFSATPKRPLSASAKKPSASGSSSATTPRSASTKKDHYPGVTRPTALSEARKAGVADRKESMRVLRAEQAQPDALDMKHRPTTPTPTSTASASGKPKKFPFLQKSSGAAAGVNGRAATSAAANGHVEEQNGAADAAAASAASSSKKPAPTSAASSAAASSKRPVRTALAASFGSSAKKPAGINSSPSPRSGAKSSSSASASGASASQRPDFSALKKKGKQHQTSFEVLAPAAPSPKRVTIQEPAADAEENKQDEPDAQSTALTTTTQPSKQQQQARDGAALTPEETAAMLAPRPSQVLATLDTPTPYFPAATPVRTALIPASMALENLPASSARKVPLSLAGRTGLAHECASCHELHLRVDRQNLEIHRLSESLARLEHVRLQAEQLGREKAARNMELECVQSKLAKSDARCATLSNQLTTLRLDQEKHVKILLAEQEEKISRSAHESAEKSTAAAQAEAAAARSERDAVVLEKKGLVAKLSHIAQAKRALEMSLASLEASYKTLQEHTQLVTHQKDAAERAANNTNAIVQGQEHDAAQVAEERARMHAEAQQAREERDAFELEAHALRSELDSLRESHARDQSALENQDALQHAYDSAQGSLEGLSAHAKDLEAQVKFERDQVRALRGDLARAQAAAESVHRRDASFSARETERSQVENSYVTELAAVRQEIAQLQREKAQAVEDSARMRRQMESSARNQHNAAAAAGASNASASGYQSSPFAASSSFAATQQQQRQLPQQQHQPPQPQLSSSRSASYEAQPPQSEDAQNDAEEEHEEEEARRPTSAPSQPVVRPTRASLMSAAAAKSKIPRSSSSTSRERTPNSQAAVLETPSPRPRMASPLPSPHPKANAAGGAAAAVTSPRKPLYTPPTHSADASASSTTASSSQAQPRSGSISSRVKSPAPLSTSTALRPASAKTSGSVSPAASSAAPSAAARGKSVSPAPRSLAARSSNSGSTGAVAAAPASGSKLAATRQREAASQPLSAASSEAYDEAADDGESVPASAFASNDEDTFAEQLRSDLQPEESSGSPVSTRPSAAGYSAAFGASGSSASGSLFSPVSAASFAAPAASPSTAEEHASTAKMLQSLAAYKAAYRDSHETQQALLVLEGLIQQAGILRAKMAEKQAALSKLSAAGGASDPAAADRLRAESRVLSQTLDLTKDNIRAHYAALQASLASKDPAISSSTSTPWRPSSAATASTTPASSFRPSFALTSPPATAGGSSRFGAWNATLPLTQTSPAPAAARGNFTSSSGLFSPTVAAPPSRFMPAASSAAASAFFQQQPSSSADSSSSSFVNRSFAPSAFAPASAAAAAAAAPSATGPAGSSFLSVPFSGTFHGGHSLGVSGTLASQPHAHTQGALSSAPTSSASAVAAAPGGSTFNLQVSKDAKNIYITHSTGPTPQQQQQQQHPHGLQSPAATPSFQPRPALLTAPFNSPAPAAAATATGAGSSFAASPFASPAASASQRPMHQHAAFHSTYSPMPAAGGFNNASFLSPAGASFAARTPAAAPRLQ